MTMLLDGNVDVIVLTNDLGTRDSHVLPALSPNADHRRITFSLVWFCCHAAQGCASVSSICVPSNNVLNLWHFNCPLHLEKHLLVLVRNLKKAAVAPGPGKN